MIFCHYFGKREICRTPRNSQPIDSVIVLGVKNQEFVTSIKIPFKKFLKTDVILMVINDNL